MTNSQFELLMIHGGMMYDGLSSDAAIALILLMDEEPQDIAWLIKRVKTKKRGQ